MRVIDEATKRVAWETIGGTKYEGNVIEIDNGTAIVRLDDGTEKAVRID